MLVFWMIMWIHFCLMMEEMEGTYMEHWSKVLLSTKKSLLKVNPSSYCIYKDLWQFFCYPMYLWLHSPFSAFTFSEVGCIRTRNSMVTCCHFSSDGKLLASAGHDRKVRVMEKMPHLRNTSTSVEMVFLSVFWRSRTAVNCINLSLFKPN